MKVRSFTKATGATLGAVVLLALSSSAMGLPLPRAGTGTSATFQICKTVSKQHACVRPFRSTKRADGVAIFHVPRGQAFYFAAKVTTPREAEGGFWWGRYDKNGTFVTLGRSRSFQASRAGSWNWSLKHPPINKRFEFRVGLYVTTYTSGDEALRRLIVRVG